MTVTVLLMGGLGNQLFQFAAAEALSRNLGTDLVLDLSFFKYKSAPTGAKRQFELGSFVRPLECAQICRSKANFYLLSKLIAFRHDFFHSIFGIVKQNECFAYEQLPLISKNSVLYGYFQHPNYFADISREVCQMFMADKLIAPSEDFIRLYNKIIGDAHSVCLHIRRGDYVESKAASAFHGLPPLEYYKESAAALLKLRGNSLNFYVFSDDIGWCKSHVKFLPSVSFVDYPNLSPAETLVCMSSCKDFIIANSSFSWWAAYLSSYGEKRVYMPENWTSNILTKNIALSELVKQSPWESSIPSKMTER